MLFFISVIVGVSGEGGGSWYIWLTTLILTLLITLTMALFTASFKDSNIQNEQKINKEGEKASTINGCISKI